MDDLRGEIDRIEKRTRRYWFDDGIVEIAGGLSLLVVGLYFLVENSFGGELAPRIVNIIFPTLIGVLAFSAKWAARRLKDRFVYPRTGFVAYARPCDRRWTRRTLAGFLGLLFAIVIMRTPLVANWIPAVMGAVFAVGFFSFGRRVDLMRLPVEGFMAAVAGVAVSLLRVSGDLSVALLFGCVGLVITSGGLVALISYLRRTGRREEA